MTEPAILIVDDEPGVLEALERLFGRGGFETETATDGETALRRLRERECFLVISDQRMPGMTGIDFLQECRRASPDTLRVLVTGYSDEAVCREAINKGEVYRYVVKPWDNDEMLAIAREARAKYDLLLRHKVLFRRLLEQREALSRTQYALIAELRKVQGILDHVGEGILVADRDGVIYFANKAFEALTGLNRSEILGRSLEDFLVAGGEEDGAGCSWHLKGARGPVAVHRNVVPLPCEASAPVGFLETYTPAD
ncbi:response regulator [Dissulfurirhabdus thermomarina]|uniref:Response regulator n=1 Tax=Dissulfurirhabdus thermomarina TaxID=1765737 RepID=A0A6N9TP07_DISTH|nr:response regulator [Dissulfurirhabdus thermomarina]NDY41484.1 response regulator [Dissulfurirhabdus thermomarina]NMX23889.1 response regulator [Dissulfurirhabdus thermomarina]